MKNILVYLDEGVSGRSFREIVRGVKNHPFLSLPVKSINAAAICGDEWEKTTSLLIFPGGRDIPYHEHLKGIGCARIKNFVEKGGSYLGICAGAYFACADIEFEQGGPLEVRGQRELAFFPGRAIGPAFGHSKFSYESEKGAEPALLEWGEEDLFSVYYNGGCFFENSKAYKEISIIAKYASLPFQSEAIVYCKVGKGQAILSGVHPEYSYHNLNFADPYLQSLKVPLEISESQRANLFNHLIQLCFI